MNKWLHIQAEIRTLYPDIDVLANRGFRIISWLIPLHLIIKLFALEGRRGGGVLMLIKAELHPRAVRCKRIYD